MRETHQGLLIQAMPCATAKAKAAHGRIFHIAQYSFAS